MIPDWRQLRCSSALPDGDVKGYNVRWFNNYAIAPMAAN